MKSFWHCVAILALSSGLLAQTTAGKPKARMSAATQSSISAEIQQLRDALAAQQQQIEQLRQELQRRDQTAQQAQQQAQSAASEAQTTAQGAVATSQEAKQSLNSLQSTVTDLQQNQTNVAATLQEEQKRIGEVERPAAIHFRGVTITPGGFIEGATVFRTHNENASVNSAAGDFNIPLGGTTNANMSEFRFDGRQSRLTLLGEGKIGSTKVSGYYEVDFLGAAPTANENQSNSFNLRQRQLWAAAEFSNGIAFSAGQQWSLLTLARKGMTNRNEFLPMTVNAQYVIGYDWARQPSVRILKNFGNKTWLGFAVENPATVVNVQGITVGGTATLPPVFGFNTSPNATSPNGNFTLSNTPGANGVSTNLAPDLVAKITFEPGWGHFELKGLGRFFRDRHSTGTGFTNDKTFGGGLGVAAVLPLVKSKVDFIVEALGGNGIGRYGSGGGFDVTLRPDASIVPVRSYHALIGPEVHVGKNLDLYLYGGEESYQRTVYLVNSTTSVGYGSPLANNSGCSAEQTTSSALSCPNQTRYGYEVTPGFWYRFYKGTSGTVQWGMQYSYSKRALWSGVGGYAPTGTQSQVYASFRYYLP